ncbi:hypothetical protein GCM10010191_29130 [Actinomadura vinacea]|uniref:Fibronectin type-III domain-containing protein n=1 Tax=Actinomadura vinacea TaxID=115336 RepID=A0ABN3IXS1_9ACTN
MSGDRSSQRPPVLRRLLRRDRVTGQIAVGLVGVLCVSALVYGVGIAGSRYKLADVGAWLTATAKGVVVHANGPAGKVDGKAPMIPQMRGHRIKVVQDGTTVLLVDETTGVVSRIDPSQLKVEQSRVLGGVGLQVLVGQGGAYSVDPAKGTVQRIDPVRLAAVGQPVALTPPLGQAGMDAAGNLWVPVPQTGQLVPFQGGRQGQPVAVGKAGDRLALTIAAGTPVAINSSAATASIVRSEGTRKAALPPTVTQAVRTGGVRVPAVTDGHVVPMLGTGGALFLLNTQVGQVSPIALRLPGHRFEPPNMLGPRVYLPDRSTGRLLVFNTGTGDWERPMQVTRPGGGIEVVVRDGFLWANDPGGALAFAVDSGGLVKRIQKYDDKVPGGQRRPIPTQAGAGGGGRGADNGAGRGGNDPVPAPPPRDGTPSAPQNVRVDPFNGGMRVTFRPSAGGRPTGYALKGDTAGLQVRPSRVGAGGPYQFTVTGGGCGKTYSFSVAVQYKDSNGRNAQKTSLATAPVRPCTTPVAPANFSGAPRNKSAVLTWDGSGAGVTYLLSVDGGAPVPVKSPHTVVGLRNDEKHQFRLTAQNGAGTAPARTTTVDLAYPRRQYKNANNNQTNTLIRPAPRQEGNTNIGRIPQGEYRSLTVICQVRGGDYTESETNYSSNVWNRIEWNGGIGYLHEGLMETPRTGSFPNLPLYECEN